MTAAEVAIMLSTAPARRRAKLLSSPSRVSRSMRTTCCVWATMRVLTVVFRLVLATNPRHPM